MRPKGLVVSMQHYVEFPNLGWKIPISPDLISIGPVTIKWYGVIIAVGFLLAMIYALKRAKEFDLNPDRMIDVVLVSALFAFVGARLYTWCFPRSGRSSSAIPSPFCRYGTGAWPFTAG